MVPLPGKGVFAYLHRYLTVNCQLSSWAPFRQFSLSRTRHVLIGNQIKGVPYNLKMEMQSIPPPPPAASILKCYCIGCSLYSFEKQLPATPSLGIMETRKHIILCFLVLSYNDEYHLLIFLIRSYSFDFPGTRHSVRPALFKCVVRY